MTQNESMEDRVTRLVLEYAQNSLPPQRPLGPTLSLRGDLAVESLSLVSLTIRLGDELGVDVVALELNIGRVDTIGDLVALGQRLSGLKQTNS
jgi:acyl carrier protein